MINLAIIDDMAILRHITKVMITKRYSGVVEIREFSALDTFLKEDIEKFDLILTDYAMPGMSGIELKPYLQKNNIEIPVILISGRDFKSEMSQKELDTICDAFIERPFAHNVLFDVLDLYINLK